MGEHLKDKENSQSINHMLTSSPWSYQDLFDGIFARANKLLSDHGGKVYLLIDEVGFRKKGDASACVGRQYLGCIGKPDNGQVGVVAALNSEEFYTPISMELFMPETWQDDAERRSKAHIPESIIHRSKTTMALDTIVGIYKKVKSLEYVVFDGLYGSSIDLLATLINKKIPFVGDTKENGTIYLSIPKMEVPINKGRGRQCKIAKPSKDGISIRDYYQSLDQNEFKELDIREGTKGILTAHFHRKQVWVLHKESNSFLSMHLLIRVNKDKSVQYAFGYNAQKSTMLSMAKAQAQRVFVERVFEEGKNIVGMADYQVRSWNGFHRHMALCSLALLFLMEQKLLLCVKVGKVTAYQLQEIINATILAISSVDDVINRLAKEIPRYQEEIMKNYTKLAT
jgi:SRSO17 transposase